MDITVHFGNPLWNNFLLKFPNFYDSTKPINTNILFKFIFDFNFPYSAKFFFPKGFQSRTLCCMFFMEVTVTPSLSFFDYCLDLFYVANYPMKVFCVCFIDHPILYDCQFFYLTWFKGYIWWVIVAWESFQRSFTKESPANRGIFTQVGWNCKKIKI
jgi:hypothetical protein